MPADWTELLADASGLTDVYSTAPPLGHCKLHYLHLDERGTTATIGLTTRDLPDQPLPEWEAKPFNSLTFYLVCEEITEVTLNGWETPTPTLQLAPATAGMRVTAENASSSLHLTAQSLRIEGVRTTLVSETAT
jgi:hypothetical protein